MRPHCSTACAQDPTWHGEVGAIRSAAKALGNPHLRGCVLYTSSEPCPMCMGACYWARIDRVYYATTTSDVKEHGHFEDEDFYLEVWGGIGVVGREGPLELRMQKGRGLLGIADGNQGPRLAT